jgi:hypothetical protein
MRDLSNTNWIMAKGFLFLLLGFLSGAILWLEHPTTKVAALLMIAIWSFSRFYHFAFYVVERYVDSSYRFSGLLSLASHAFRAKR